MTAGAQYFFAKLSYKANTQITPIKKKACNKKKKKKKKNCRVGSAWHHLMHTYKKKKKKPSCFSPTHPYHFSKETDGATGWNSHLLHPTTHKNPCLCPPQAAQSPAGPHHHLRRVHGPSHREVWWTTSHRMWLRCTILSSKLKRLAPVSC